MSIQHSAITAAVDCHEPKGLPAIADEGKAYVSTGAGSGSWQYVQKRGFACIKGSSATATTGITSTYQAINNATLAGTITWAQNNAEAFTTNVTGGFIQVPEACTVHFTANISINSVAAEVFYFTIGVDSGAGIVEKSTSILAVAKATASVSDLNLSLACIPTLLANDKVYLMVKSTGGAECTFTHINFVAVRAS